MDAARRAISDDRYAKMTELLATLPQSATEFRFAIFRSRRGTEAKSSFRPLEKIFFSKFQGENFGDESTLAAYLHDKYGPGRYFIEALDEHNQRMIKIPSYTVTAGDEDDMEDDEYDDEPRSGWRRGRRRELDDEDDDPREQRANMADLLTTVGKQNAAQVATVARGSSDMLSLMMMTQSQSADARAAEERRRDEQRTDERKREEDRAENRRREQEIERKERDVIDQRRRDDERREREAAEQRRRDESLAMMQASNKRTEIFVAAVAAAVPVLGKIFEKKEDTTLPILLKSMEKKEDPVMLMLLKGMMDKAHDDSASKNMINQFGEMSKITAQMTQEQMRSMMTLSNDINGAVMKKALDMMMASPQGSTPEGKSIIEQVMSAVAGAADIVKTLVPSMGQQTQPRNAHLAAPTAALPAPVAAAPAPAAAATEQKTPAQAELDSMTPEQRAAAEANAPTGAMAVIHAIMAIQTNQYANQAEYQGLIRYLVTEMPLDLRVAVLDGNEQSVMGIMMPIVQSVPDIQAWILKPGVIDWVRAFVAQLPPSLEGVHGPAAAQREQYVAEIQAAQAAQAAAPEELPVVDISGAEPVPTGEAAPAPTADVVLDIGTPDSIVDTPVEAVADKSPIPGPGSHLDADPNAP